MKRFYIFLILGMLLMGTQTAQSMTIDYSNAFTLRDWDNNGNVDYIDDTNNGIGFWGSITDSPWTDEHFLEFNISGLPLASQAYLNIESLNPIWSSLYSSSKDVNIAYYLGNGVTDGSVFGTGTLLASMTLTDIGSYNFTIDIQSIYNSFISGNVNYLGFRLYDPTWTSSPSTGAQVAFINSTLNISPASVPEPGTLLLLGSGLIGIVVWRKRFGRKQG